VGIKSLHMAKVATIINSSVLFVIYIFAFNCRLVVSLLRELSFLGLEESFLASKKTI